MSKNVIRDNYTKQGYIARTDDLHDELEFEYRPMLPEAVQALDNTMKNAEAGKDILLMAAKLSQQITSWGEVDEKGKPCPIDIDHVRRLPYLVLAATHKIVTGLRPSDPRPSSKATASSTDDLTRELEALIEQQKKSGQVVLAADQKNLGRG